ncbi:hypothetical protein HAX54_030090, partial [Datura stramonium]|nr:hypothetical protein [Datura stramonium]
MSICRLTSRSVELRRGEHCRTVLGKPPPQPPSVCGVVGTLCRGRTERQMAMSRATRARAVYEDVHQVRWGKFVTPLVSG